MREFGDEMLLLRKPSATGISRFLAEQAKLELTYKAIGATGGDPPTGYVLDHTRFNLGSGEATFELAKDALRNWKQFRLGWLEAAPDDTPIVKGAVVAIVAQAFGFWWLNACRIIATFDEVGKTSRFGFAYGTLPSHIGTGEERFLIEWDQTDDSVWYDVLAFSKPNHLLARSAYPLVRRAQKRFGRESSEAMLKAVSKSRC